MCQIDYADGDWVQLADEHRKARKPHRCTDCWRTIQPGERYRHVRGVSTGQPDTIKQCAHCEAAGAWLTAICRGYLYNGIGEELAEPFHEEPDFRCRTLALLVAGHRRRWDGKTPAKVATLTKYAIRWAKRQIDAAVAS